MDPENGHQPMTVYHDRRAYTIVYNGEIYNTVSLARELGEHGVNLHTRCDTEAVVYAYAVFGEDCLSHLSGIFAFAIWDRERRVLFCARDRMGVKPFWFCEHGGKFLFASEIKALLAHPDISPTVGQEGLWQLLFLSPVTLRGSSIYRGIYELRPGECCTVDESGLRRRTYFRLSAKPFSETRDEAVEHTRELLLDAIRSQTVSDVPLCCLLSGGLDSSVVSAVVSKECRRRGEVLSTYSFEYEGYDYAPTLFQPNRDDEYARIAARAIGSEHTVLTAKNSDVADWLEAATLARDMPGQADIDSSLYYFCSRIRRRHTVALSGECADEIFGGYPWFYRPEMLGRDFFPWIHSPMERASLFRSEIARPEEGFAYLSEIYRGIVDGVEFADSDSPEMRTSRIASVLSQTFFMQSLLERKDRMSMAHGLEVRVPFADHRIAEYVYNVPWEYKFEGKVEKSLLRTAMEGYLPHEILYRKKSPYPKTHNPEYERRVRELLASRLSMKGSRLSEMLDRKRLDALLSGDQDVTWFGQLMSRPQLIAWLIQFDIWAERYKVDFAF
jgi:asparagine synthase (glutamine-hydrolysing)